MKQDSKFAEFYELTYDDLWYYCLRRTPSPADAEDCLGDAFAIAWQKFDTLPSRRDARPWLFTIAANVLRNHNRKYARRERVHLRLIDDAERLLPVDKYSPESIALRGGAEIEMAFRSLRPKDQEILALAAWEELDNGEIGAFLGCSAVAVRSRLHRARKKFEQLLDDLQQIDLRQQVRVEEVADRQRLKAR